MSDRLNSLQKSLGILVQVAQGGHLNQACDALGDDKDRALVTELCYGVCRYYFALDAIIAVLLARPLKLKHVDLKLCMMLGLYQLEHMKYKPYAVVNETVALAKHCGKAWGTGLINAVLRQFIRTRASLLPNLRANLQFQSALPTWLYQRLQQYGLDTPELLQPLLQQARLNLRVIASKLPTMTYINQLSQQGITATACDGIPSAVVIEKGLNPVTLPGFDQGHIFVQDLGAQLAVPLLDVQSQHHVLDACCAPGGKLSHLAEQLTDESHLLGLDIEAKRLLRVKENLKRLGFERVRLKTADATRSESWWDGKRFDRVLLDAPCSALGVMRRHPDVKLHRTVEDVSYVCDTQRQLLLAMLDVLKSGGRLLYATCSLLPEENDDQIRWLLKQTCDIAVMPIHLPIGKATQYGWQIWPGVSDGFYYCLIEKN